MKSQSFILGIILQVLPLGSHADSINVAVATNFAAPLAEIARKFRAATGHQIKISSSASGKIYAQIKNGAPFAVFLSADEEKPLALEQEGLSVPGSRFTYAIGRLALWSPRDNLVTDGPQILQRGEFRKLALANPKLAPYGKAAVEVLDALGLAEATKSRWVMGENIAQTYQFIQSGAADFGFVAAAQILAESQIKSGSAWLIPAELHQPIRQDAILLRKAENSRAARELLTFLRSEQVRALIESYGYQTEPQDR